MRKNITNLTWFLNDDQRTQINIKDPRVRVARHCEWVSPKISNYPGGTPNLGLEPDNFTHAVMFSKPHYIPELRNQIWFKDLEQNAWISLYYVPHSQRDFYQQWLTETPYWASWSAVKPSAVRYYINPIDQKTNDRNRNYVKARIFEERLYDQGYVEQLQRRGLTPEFIKHRCGVARPLVAEPEEVTELELDF